MESKHIIFVSKDDGKKWERYGPLTGTDLYVEKFVGALNANATYEKFKSYKDEPGCCYTCTHRESAYANGLYPDKIDESWFPTGDPNTKSVLGQAYARCKIGHNDQLKEYWEKNGHKKTSEIDDIYECKESDLLSLGLQSLNDSAQEMLDILKKEK